jgi:DNA modification methylase
MAGAGLLRRLRFNAGVAPMKPSAQVFTGNSMSMPDIETGSVGLIFESSPYEKMVKCCGEPACLSSHTAENFVREFAKFLPERLRVLAHDGNYVVNFQPQVINGFTSPSEYLIPQAVVTAGFKLTQTHIWAKPNASPFAPDRRLKNSFEYCWHFAKTDRYYFDKDASREPHEWAARDSRQERYHALGKDPGNVFFMSKSNDQSSLGHPAKMTNGVASRFIKLLTKPGDLVVDGFAGTGTTGVEALVLGRRFAGYELHEERADQARGRLGIETEGLTMKKTWMNAKEVAAYTGFALPTIYSKSSRKEMPVCDGSGEPRYHVDEVDAWLKGEWKPEVNKTAQSSAKED